MNTNEAVARIVLEHWRTAALEREGELWMILPHVLTLIESALDGETSLDLLGMDDGSDAERLRSLCGMPQNDSG